MRNIHFESVFIATLFVIWFFFPKVRPSASASTRNITTTTSTTITTPSTTANTTTCASEYPFAYLNGYYCCKTNQELPYGGSIAEYWSGTCDGKGFSRESTCCKDHDYKECPHLEGCYDFSEGKYICRYRILLDFKYQGGVKSTVSGVFEDCVSQAETANWAETGKLQFWF